MGLWSAVGYDGGRRYPRTPDCLRIKTLIGTQRCYVMSVLRHSGRELQQHLPTLAVEYEGAMRLHPPSITIAPQPLVSLSSVGARHTPSHVLCRAQQRHDRRTIVGVPGFRPQPKILLRRCGARRRPRPLCPRQARARPTVAQVLAPPRPPLSLPNLHTLSESYAVRVQQYPGNSRGCSADRHHHRRRCRGDYQERWG